MSDRIDQTQGKRAFGALALAALVLGCGGAPRPELVRVPVERPAALLLRDVAVLDVATGARTPGRDVLVRGDRIEAISETGASAAPPDAVVIDGAGGTLLPGLVDAHAHLMSDASPPWRLELPDPDFVLRSYLYCGVTSVFDAADSSPEALPRRERVAAGLIPGPRVFTAGTPITAPDGHPVALVRQLLPWWLGWYVAPRTALQVATPEEARGAADRLARSGVDFVKLIVDRIPPEAPRIGAAELRAAVESAHALGVRAVAHIGTLEDARDAARAGVDAWVHGVYRERLSDAAVAELAAFGIPMVPTLAVFDSYAATFDVPREPTPLERQIASPELLASFDQVPEDSDAVARFRPFLEMLRAQRLSGPANAGRLHQAGVVLFAGSDPQSGVFPGAGLHRELALLVAAGLTPAEAIRAATLAPAQFLSRSQTPDFGEVAVGRRADLLLVDGDPSADVTALAQIREVILGGARVERTPIRKPL